MTMLMVDNCPKCGKVFQKNLRNLCQGCIRAYDTDLNKCFDYLRSSRKASTEELSTATGVAAGQIHTFIKEGRLLLGSYPNITYPCNSCLAPIREHNLCGSCRVRIVSDFNDLKAKEARERSVGFRIGDRINKN